MYTYADTEQGVIGNGRLPPISRRRHTSEMGLHTHSEARDPLLSRPIMPPNPKSEFEEEGAFLGLPSRYPTFAPTPPTRNLCQENSSEGK